MKSTTAVAAQILRNAARESRASGRLCGAAFLDEALRHPAQAGSPDAAQERLEAGIRAAAAALCAAGVAPEWLESAADSLDAEARATGGDQALGAHRHEAERFAARFGGDLRKAQDVAWLWRAQRELPLEDWCLGRHARRRARYEFPDGSAIILDHNVLAERPEDGDRWSFGIHLDRLEEADAALNGDTELDFDDPSCRWIDTRAVLLDKAALAMLGDDRKWDEAPA